MVKKLRNVRIKRGYTVRGLADELGVHYSLVSYWETGKRNPKSVNKSKLEEVLGVPYYELLEEEKGESDNA